jgi:hypothetical protein
MKDISTMKSQKSTQSSRETGKEPSDLELALGYYTPYQPITGEAVAYDGDFIVPLLEIANRVSAVDRKRLHESTSKLLSLIASKIKKNNSLTYSLVKLAAPVMKRGGAKDMLKLLDTLSLNILNLRLIGEVAYSIAFKSGKSDMNDVEKLLEESLLIQQDSLKLKNEFSEKTLMSHLRDSSFFSTETKGVISETKKWPSYLEKFVDQVDVLIKMNAETLTLLDADNGAYAEARKFVQTEIQLLMYYCELVVKLVGRFVDSDQGREAVERLKDRILLLLITRFASSDNSRPVDGSELCLIALIIELLAKIHKNNGVELVVPDNLIELAKVVVK